ncbi:putative ripening-related protein 6 [Hordeum vulgare subsp. vulgare]|uniref:Uncharacterized protein n=1 Tax=Hordeum vulgare subsp. vulgare TaxID=112509 RepID=A0A8I6X2J3_HORVV|nr:putative ripening-related protein 6 [Hordeum vulgare subsp. vulgare]KAI5016718.1 hypothetical protein ZWY2020_006569 [Hordeum vulgare]
MAYGKLAALAVLVVLLQASTGAASRSSPAVSASKIDSMPAEMSLNGFERGEDGGAPAECDGKYHSDGDMLAALSTEWYAGGARCFRTIRVTNSATGQSVEATVVDECDTRRGCKSNIVDTSKAVWKALGLDTNVGEVAVTWSDA